MMSMLQLCRLYYLTVQLSPDLPGPKLMGLLGRNSLLLKSGAEVGLSNATLPGVNMDQLSQYYMTGSESGAEPSMQEFRASMVGLLQSIICERDELDYVSKAKLSSELYSWYNGRLSQNGDGEIDWDAEVDTPPFTATGFWPVDNLFGGKLVQEVYTLLAKPETGKTTLALALAHQWKLNGIGPVIMIQTEIAPSALRMRIDQMSQGRKLFESGVDRIIFGRRGADNSLKQLIENPDNNRLVLFDSIGGYCGGGDTPDGRKRYHDLYDMLCQVKNNSRLVVACGHLKRGVDIADIESAAGSSAIEKFSGGMACITKSNVERPDGMLAVKLDNLKNRYGVSGNRVKFLLNYVSGHAEVAEDDEINEAMEALS